MNDTSGSVRKNALRIGSPIHVDGSQVQPAEEPKAFRKSAKLRIFLSHKSADAESVEHIAKYLEDASAQKISVFVSSRIAVGVEWRRYIQSAMKQADLLIFLYRTGDHTFDWCFFETGFFDGVNHAQDGKIVVLHPRDAKPDPLGDLQLVPVDPTLPLGDTPLERWLVDLFTKPTPGGEVINSAFDPAGPYGRPLVDAFLEPFGRSSPRQIHELLPSLTLKICPEKLRRCKRTELPDDAVWSMDPQLQMLLVRARLLPGARTWSSLIELLDSLLPRPVAATPESAGQIWCKTLAAALHDVLARVEGRPARPPLALPLLRTSGGDEPTSYRPYISRVERSREGLCVHITFVGIGSELDPQSRGKLGPSTALLNLARTFRFGFLEVFERKLSSLPANPLRVEQLFDEVMEELFAVLAETAARGIESPHDLKGSLAEDREQVLTSVAAWPELFDRLRTSCEARDASGALAALKGMREINARFYPSCARRHAELVAAECAPDIPAGGV